MTTDIIITCNICGHIIKPENLTILQIEHFGRKSMYQRENRSEKYDICESCIIIIAKILDKRLLGYYLSKYNEGLISHDFRD